MTFKCFVIVLFCALYSWNTYTYGYSPDITYTPSFQRNPHRVQNQQMANYLNSKRPYPYMRPPIPIVQRVILKPLVPQSYYRNQPVIQDLPFNPQQRFNLGPVVNQNNIRVIPDVIAKVEKITSFNPESSIKLKKQRESEDRSAEKSSEENESEEEEDIQREHNRPKASKSDKEISNHSRPSDERIKKSTAKEEKVDHPEHHSPQPTNQWKKIKISPVRYEVKEQFEEIDKGGRGNQDHYETRITHSHGGDNSDWHKKKGETGDKESITDHHEEKSSKSKDGSGHEHKEESDEHHSAKKGEKGKKHGSKKHHKKGSETSGYHNVFHKDEFKEEKTFYDEADHKGSHHKYGKEHHDHHKEKGDKNYHSHDDKHHSKKEHSEKGHSEKGHHEKGHE